MTQRNLTCEIEIGSQRTDLGLPKGGAMGEGWTRSLGLPGANDYIYS